MAKPLGERAAGEVSSQVDEEAEKQLCQTQYRIPAPKMIGTWVAPSEEHDDCLIRIALIAEALTSYVRPRALYERERPY